MFQKHDLSDDRVWLLPTEHDMSCFLAAPLASPSGRWGQTLCPIDAQTAILIGGQGARMQFCKDPMWKLCTGQSVQQHFRLSLILQLRREPCLRGRSVCNRGRVLGGRGDSG